MRRAELKDSMVKQKQIRHRAAHVLSVWAQLAPNEKFGGYTLEEFRACVAKGDLHRQRLAELRASRLEARRLLDEAHRELNEIYLNVVDGVKGHEMFGANSPLYKAMGYVPRDERRSGLTRRPLEIPPDQTPPNGIAPAAGTTRTP